LYQVLIAVRDAVYKSDTPVAIARFVFSVLTSVQGVSWSFDVEVEGRVFREAVGTLDVEAKRRVKGADEFLLLK